MKIGLSRFRQFAEERLRLADLRGSTASWRLDETYLGVQGASQLELDAAELVRRLNEMASAQSGLEGLAGALDHLRRLRTAADLLPFAPCPAMVRASLSRVRPVLHDAVQLGWQIAAALVAGRREVPAGLEPWVARLRAHPLGRPDEDAALSRARDRADHLRHEAFVGADTTAPDALPALRQLAAARRLDRLDAVAVVDTWLAAAEPKAAEAFAALDAGLGAAAVPGTPPRASLLARAAWVLGMNEPGLEAAGQVTFSGASALAGHYAEVKARALGLDRLHWTDRLAAWPGAAPPRLGWSEAVRHALAALATVHPRLGELAHQLVREGRVGADPRHAPMTGFSHPGSRLTGPYVRLNFDGSLAAALTLSHELGHACHQWLARSAAPLVEDPGHALAEAVALTSERAALERLGQHGSRLWSLAVAVEQDFSLLVRQPAIFAFERAARWGAGRSGRTFAPAELGSLWIKAASDHFGSAFDLSGFDRHWIRSAQIFADPFYSMAYPLGLAAAQAVLSGTVGGLQETLQSGDTEPSHGPSPPYLDVLEAGGEIDLGRALEMWHCPPIDVCMRHVYARAHRRLDEMATRLRQG